MRWLHRVRQWLRVVLRRDRLSREVDREVRFHLDQEVDELVRVGMTRDQARQAALRSFGNVRQIQEACLDAPGVALFGHLQRDVRYAVRTFARTPGFAVAVLSLAFAVGATTAVYSTADWLLNRSASGVERPEYLVSLGLTEAERPSVGMFGLSAPQYLALRQVQKTFADLAVYGKVPGVVSWQSGADQVVVELASGNYFQLLGVRPALGRLFTAEDDALPVAVLSHDFWQSRWGGATDVIGTSVRVNGQPCRVIGVLPRTFEGYRLDWNGPTSVWVPMQNATPMGMPYLLTSVNPFFRVVGRLRPGLTIDDVRAQMQAWLPELPALPAGMVFKPTAIVAAPDHEMRLRPSNRAAVRGVFGLLLAVCSLTVLAAGFNVANVLIGRSMGRRRELALRAALGASRLRLAAQLGTESMLLGLATALGAAVLGVAGVRLLSALPSVYLNLPWRTTALTVAGAGDWRLLGVATTLAVAAALLFAFLPALSSSFRDPILALKHPRPAWAWAGLRLTFRQVVLTAQIAVSVTLAVTAGLYGRSAARAAAVGSDYREPESVLVVQVRAGRPAERKGFYGELLDRTRAVPGVAAAAMGSDPLHSGGRAAVSASGREGSGVRTGIAWVSPGHFETLGVPMVRGRDFDGTDHGGGRGVVVSRLLAHTLWPGADPVGRSVQVQYETVPRTVVGVAADDRCNDLLDEPRPCAWLPLGETAGYLRIRTHGPPLAFVPTLRALVHDLDPDAAVGEETTLAALIRDITGTHRMLAMLSATLALLSVALAAIGCAVLFQSMIKDSVRELAIRIALGAGSWRLMRRVLYQGLALTLAGTAAGVVAARFVSARLGDQLYRTAATDPLVFAAAAIGVMLLGLLTIGHAALAVTRTDPVRYLRAE